jgi:predicted ATPase/Tfp pilus assembly protein PilF
LPHLGHTFIGRQAELSQISRQLEETAVRLLTITGPGGVGKTHLALQAAARCAPDFRHGVHLVNLDSLEATATTPHEALLSLLTITLNLPVTDKQSLQKQLLHYLHQKEMLLLLDNFEQFTPATGLLSTIFSHAPHVKCLVTSRIPLQLPEEQLLRLDGLPYPQQTVSPSPQPYAALSLFAACAQQVAPNFSLTAENLPHISHICQLVDGLPLGLELAARAVRAFSPAQIAAQLQHDLDFLASNARDLPDRHRSLRHVFNYSWELLSPAEQAAFAALSVFPSPFTEEAAHDVTGITAVHLHQLTSKGLLQPTADSTYQMHNLLRHYGQEKLQENPATAVTIQAAHARYYATLLQHLQPLLESQRQNEALQTIRRNLPHLRRAWQWGIEQVEVALLDQIIPPACRFLAISGLYQEAADQLQQTITMIKQQAPLTNEGQLLHIRCLVQYGAFLCSLAQYETAVTTLTTALTAAQKLNARPETAACYREQGNLALTRGLLDQAKQDLQQSLALYQAEGDERGQANVWHRLGQLYFQLSQAEPAQNAFNHSLSLYRHLAHPQGTALALSGLALIVHYWTGAYREAEPLYLEALALKRALGHRHGMANDLNNLGNLACNLKEFDHAIRYYEESLAIKRDVGLPLGIAITLSNLGTAYQELGHYERASALYEESLGISQKLGDQVGVLFCLANLAELAHVQQQYGLSERRWRRVLQLSLAAQTPDRLLYCLAGLACLWADPVVPTTNRSQAAVMLYYVQSHPGCNQSVREKIGPPLAQLAALLPAAALADAQTQAATWETADIEALLV